MSRLDNEIRITLSVLDRLIDDRPDQSREAAASRQTSLRLLKQAVKRDLEWLLNTRATPEAVPEGLTEVRGSLALYGLPDLTTVSVKNPDDRMRLRDAVAETVRLFEPRLEGVEVSLEGESEAGRSVRFRIDARLKVDPVPEPVTFDTTLQLTSGEFQVKGEA
jgi:type VI secretion system protein ImpF